MTTPCEDSTCSAHNTLATDSKWMKKGMYSGFVILLSAIVYFNKSTQSDYREINMSIQSLQATLLKEAGVHKTTMEGLAVRMDYIEDWCCDKE